MQILKLIRIFHSLKNGPYIYNSVHNITLLVYENVMVEKCALGKLWTSTNTELQIKYTTILPSPGK